MMWQRRVLGVDVGTSSVKVAQVAFSASGRRRLCRLAVCDGLAGLAEILGRREWWKRGDRLHLGFPSDRMVVRRLTLPFKDPDQIARTLPFELEGEVPFPVEEIVASYVVVASGGEGTEVLAMATPREGVSQWLERFRAAGPDPAILEPEAAALGRLAPKGPSRGGSLALVEMGASKTHLLLCNEGRMRLMRSLRMGLGAAPDSSTIPAALSREVQRTLLAVRARGDAPWPEVVYLAGGGVCVDGAAPWLSAQWGMPVEALELSETVPVALEEPTEHPPARLATAIGLALAGSARGGRCTADLRVGQLAYRPGLSIYRGRAVAAAVLFVVAAAAGMADLHARVSARQKALHALQRETQALFRQVMPQGAQMADPARQMQKALEERQARQLNLLGQDPRGTVVELLREISVREQARNLRLTEFDLSGDVISFRGEANAYDTIEKAKDHWQASPLLEAVEIKSAKKNPKNQLWDFQCGARRKLS